MTWEDDDFETLTQSSIPTLGGKTQKNTHRRYCTAGNTKEKEEEK